MPTSQIQEVASKDLPQPRTDAAFGTGVSGGRVEAKRSNLVLKVPFIDDLHNRGGCWLSFAIGDRTASSLQTPSPETRIGRRSTTYPFVSDGINFPSQ